MITELFFKLLNRAKPADTSKSQGHQAFSKYAANGRLYSDDNRPAFTNNYIARGYTQPNAGKLGWETPARPYNEGINSAKRSAHLMGYKSLKQFQRALKRS